jgi:putative NADH-flavin reductase
VKVLIVGAAGPLGMELVRRALKQDHQVTALVRSRNPLTKVKDPNLTVIECDVLRPGSLDTPMANQEAVICSIGVKPTRKKVTVFSDGTDNLIRAMQRHNVLRLFCITGIGAGNSRGHGGFLYDRIIQPLFFRTIYQDKDKQERLVEQCDRDWMIVRPARLTEGKATGNFAVVQRMQGLTASSISRADVAGWVVSQLEVDRYLYRTVVLTN